MWLSDEQLALLEQNPEYKQYGDVCPVCRGTGEYKLYGEVYECPQDDYGHTFHRRAKLYWVAGIGLQYQTLDWAKWHHLDIKPDIDNYIDKYEFLRLVGAGLTFYSEGLGTGKTWAATHILKELVKRGIDGYFLPFFQIKEYEEEGWRERMARVKSAELVVIDEIRKPASEAERRFFAEHLEGVIRPRTNSNFPTILTTNMTPKEIGHDFPRSFSLLTAKNDFIDLSGAVDARVDGNVWRENMELALNGETRPIV